MSPTHSSVEVVSTALVAPSSPEHILTVALSTGTLVATTELQARYELNVGGVAVARATRLVVEGLTLTAVVARRAFLAVYSFGVVWGRSGQNSEFKKKFVTYQIVQDYPTGKPNLSSPSQSVHTEPPLMLPSLSTLLPSALVS